MNGEEPLADLGADMTRLMQATFMVGQHIANMYRQAVDDAAIQDVQAAADIRRLLRVQSEVAAPLYERVHSPTFWETATSDDMIASYDAALRFTLVDPQAALASERIERELHTRYGIDVRAEHARTGDIAQVLNQLGHTSVTAGDVAATRNAVDPMAAKSAELITASRPAQSPISRTAHGEKTGFKPAHAQHQQTASRPAAAR